jgi:hypothetical protein
MVGNLLDCVCCLDFEASGFGERSYPIEAAVVECATLECRSWLIRPSPRWMSEGTWSAEAAALHRIEMSDLLTDGLPIAQVATELAECCRGKQVLCDGGEHDQRWLTTLFAAAERNVPFLIGDFDSFASALAQGADRCSDQLVESSEFRVPMHHRAPTDARLLAEMLRQLALRV